MLTKAYQRNYVPAKAGVDAVAYQPAMTVCTPVQPAGHWENVCTRIELSTVGTSTAIPPGGQLVVVYDPDGAIDPLTQQVKVIDSYIRVCTSTWVDDGAASSAPVCTYYPEVQEVEGVAAVPARYEYRTSLQWGDAGADSVESQAGDCVCALTMGVVVGVVVGFTAELENQGSVGRLTHALYFHQDANAQPLVSVIESGRSRTTDIAYAAGDDFSIERVGTSVSYWHNGNRIYSSQVPSSGVINVGSALYASGDWIE